MSRSSTCAKHSRATLRATAWDTGVNAGCCSSFARCCATPHAPKHRIARTASSGGARRSAEEEDAAASIGINVTRTKLQITVLSAVMTCLGGVLYAQYQLYINPETVSGIGISLQMVFGVIACGMFVMLGPTFGAVFLLALQEILRVLIGNQVHGLDLLIYGALLVFFIIKMPKGILGTWLERRT